MAHPKPKPSFSPYRRWGVGLHVGLIILLIFTVVVMVNYISREFYLRLQVSSNPRNPLSERTVKFVRSLTNDINVILYYDRDEPLYSTVSELLNEYRGLNRRMKIRVVDYIRDPGAAQELRTKYGFLASQNAKNLIIFDCEGRVKPVDGNSLTKYILEQVPSEKEREFRRKPTAFEGEKAFTSTLLAVTSPKPLKAYFLHGHGEHEIDSGDENVGYLKFASVLRQNYIAVEKISLLGTNQVPMDCNLLVIAGPTTAIPEVELQKVSQYLDQGGRLLALFNVLALSKGETGLERVLAKWNVAISTNVVKDPEHTSLGSDVIVGAFSKHAIVNPLMQLSLHLILPRAVGKLNPRAPAGEAPQVEEIAFSGPKAELSGTTRPPQQYPLMVAVEKGAIKGVISERGNTRMVITGDSIFLANHQIESAANRDFAAYAANWLLDRTQLLEGLGPREVKTFRLSMTPVQLTQVRWLLLGAMPGAALAIGLLVWFRRRR